MERITDKEIIFSRKTSPAMYVDKRDYLELFFKNLSNYITDVLRVRKYYCWNELVDLLGISTSPEEIENTEVYRYCGKGLSIQIISDKPTEKVLRIMEV